MELLEAETSPDTQMHDVSQAEPVPSVLCPIEQYNDFW